MEIEFNPSKFVSFKGNSNESVDMTLTIDTCAEVGKYQIDIIALGDGGLERRRTFYLEVGAP